MFLLLQDEQEINGRKLKLLDKILKLAKNGATINDEVYKMLSSEIGVPLEDDDDDDDDNS